MILPAARFRLRVKKRGDWMYKLIRHRRGTDKPIEIFIALFIILAVAMVILKMFSGQIQDKTKELQKLEQREKFQQARGDAQRECEEICTISLQNDCGLQQKAQYCQHKLQTGLDIDQDGDYSSFSLDMLGGIGICESDIYCPYVSECNCKGDMSMSNCVDVLWQFYRSEDYMGLKFDQACDLLYKRIYGSECKTQLDVGETAWWTAIYRKIGTKNNGTMSCFHHCTNSSTLPDDQCVN